MAIGSVLKAKYDKTCEAELKRLGSDSSREKQELWSHALPILRQLLNSNDGTMPYQRFVRMANPVTTSLLEPNVFVEHPSGVTIAFDSEIMMKHVRARIDEMEADLIRKKGWMQWFFGGNS